ncbi:MAG: ABC transporter ATP-binding protein [Lachnospiraceae bacterium]|nr:ABC transporter ATP-binding protein [Lachnospiraceae bacterium]
MSKKQASEKQSSKRRSSKKASKKPSKFVTLFKMLGLVRPLTSYMILAVAAGTLAYLAVQFIPVLGGYAILSGLGLDVPIAVGTIWILLPVLALVRAILRFVEQRLNHYIAFTLLALVRDRVFGALRRLCPAKLEGRDKGDLVSLITSDVELLEVFYAHTISPICIALIVETVMCIYIGTFHVGLGLLALAAYLCVGIVVPVIISGVSGNMGDKVRKHSADLSSCVLENIRGLDETIQYDGSKSRMAAMRQQSKTLLWHQNALNRLTGLNLAIANTFILVFDVLMVAAAGWLYMTGKVGFDGFLLPVLALLSSFGPVSALASLGTTLQNTVASGARVLAILEEEPETEEITGREEVEFHGADCRKVTFGYRRENVLSNFSLSIHENQIIGIVGESGCGKSTLMKLLMRFWDVKDGRIGIVDDPASGASGRSVVDLREINTSNLRDMQGYMTQDTEMFKDTIAGNIRIAKLDATQEEIEEACKKASVHDWIMTLPDGYETNVGELGDTLSGGERQRIGLARAFLHDAPFMLLDEPTSNLDSLNETVILKALKEEAKGKTVLLVSHRKSTMRVADTEIAM